jgi:hypothetical protein
VGAQVDRCAIETAPGALDQRIVDPTTSSLRADRDMPISEDIGEAGAHELPSRSVLSIAEVPFRFAASSGACAEFCSDAVGDPMGGSRARGPFDNRNLALTQPSIGQGMVSLC